MSAPSWTAAAASVVRLAQGGPGLVDRLLTESGAIVYDPNVTEHHHLVCSACGAIIDVEAPVDDSALIRAARHSGFTPAESQVVVSGLCASCRH